MQSSMSELKGKKDTTSKFMGSNRSFGLVTLLSVCKITGVCINELRVKIFMKWNGAALIGFVRMK